MGPRTVFTRDQVIEAGIDLIRHKGAEQLTVRHIADHIGSSTQPLYRLYKNINDIEKNITAAAVSMMFDKMISRNDRESSFLGIGIGFIEFAIQEPNLFKYLFFSGKHTAGKLLGSIEKKSLYSKMREDHLLETFPDEKLDALLGDMTLYCLGLAVEICYEENIQTLEQYRAKLEYTGGRLILSEYFMENPHITMEELRNMHFKHHTSQEK